METERLRLLARPPVSPRGEDRRGDFMRWPATGARVSVPMMGMYEVEDGLIARGRLYFAFAAMLMQRGHD